MPTITAFYPGDLIVNLKHVRSGVEIHTEAPPDNQGKGESFSPTDLACAALGSCMMTLMGIAGNKENIDLSGTSFEIIKIMNPLPRKIKEIIVEFKIKSNFPLSDNQKILLENAAHTCPVALSLSSELTQTVQFTYL